jgi:leucyl aminopeptidase
MEFALRQANIADCETQCVIIAGYSDSPLFGNAAKLDQAVNGQIQALISSGDVATGRGKTSLLHGLDGITTQRVLFVGMGKKSELEAAGFHSACHAGGAFLRDHAVTEAVSCLHEVEISGQDSGWAVRQSALAIGNANYRYTTTKDPADDAHSPLATLAILAAAELQPQVDQAAAMHAGFSRARQLGNLPPNICNPAFLAAQGEEIAAAYDRCSVEILETAAMEELGMNALLGVARGSRNNPRLIILKYQGAADAEKPVVLVGKGITFDTGGISLKPGEHMDQMKYDMCGAASVMGAFEACARLQLPLNLISIVAAVENMPDGDAYRPGDVITSMSGQTIEVLNTDAEGRMILCDALTYSDRFDPEVLIDVATLTGACVVALGHHASGLMSKHDDLARQLIRAGNECVDRAWRLPLWDDYQSQLDTPFADMKNVGGMPAGSVTAGCFLSRFTKDKNWAHIDVAGSAWKWATQEGATGRPTGLLTQFLINKAT